LFGGTLLGSNIVTGIFDFNGTINGSLTVAPGSSGTSPTSPCKAS